MEIDYEWLRTFVAAAGARTFAEAASRRRVSVSAISQQLKLLEARLGVALFERVGRRARLTDAGRGLAESVTAELGRIDDALAGLSGQAREVRGRIRVGSPMGFARVWLRPRLPALLAAHPGLALEIDFAVPSRLERRLVDGELDLCLLVRPAELPGVVTRVVAEETFVAVGRKKLDPSLESLRSQRWIVFDEDLPMLRPWWRQAFGPRAPLPEQIACRVASLDEMLALAEAGVGLTVLPDYLVASSLQAGRLVALPARRPARNTLFLAWRRSVVETARFLAVRDALAA